jgi:type I restriction enzyme S subunit
MVPNGWNKRKLTSLCDKIAVGLAISVTPYMANSGVKLIRNQNIKRNYFNTKSVVYITDEFAAKNNSKRVYAGDVVAVRTGSNIGEACVVPAEFDGALTFTTLIARPKNDELSSDYLSTHINSEYGVAEVQRLMAGGGKPNLNSGELKNYTLLTPPLQEQRKIAKILSTWDKAISTTEKLIETSKQQKKALMQQLLTGKKRLVNPETGKVFEGNWKFSQFNELYKVANNKATQVKSGEYLESGRTPIVDQGKSIVGGYTNNEITYKDLPVIVFGDHTRIVKWVDFEFAQGADGTQVLKSHKSMDEKFAYYVLLNTDIPNLGYSRHMRELKERDFKYPISKVEQQKIASVLTAADKEIEVLEAKLAHFKQEKKALMQQLLTGKRRVKVDEDVAA